MSRLLAWKISLAAAVGGVIITAASTHAAVQSGLANEIEYTRLLTELGLAMPTGAGVTVSHVEAPEGGNYTPDTGDLTHFGGTTGGIGQMMFVFYAYSIELNRIVVCMIAVGVVALVLDRAIRFGMRLLMPWTPR